MRVVVPVAVERPKTRLADVLTSEERVAFSRAMLADVLRAIRGAGGEPEVLATASLEADAPVTVDERPLTPAVNAALVDLPTGVVMADLPLATPEALEELFETSGDVAIAPGRGGGTNALVVRHPEFSVDYHGGSFLKHRAAVVKFGSLGVVDSHRLATDVDEPGDLVELLIHGEGAAADWLRDAGFELVEQESRLAVTRE
jgi:2-phospho-L-lactate/phosphoenolpyruvate guanylyltransferase